MRKTRIKKDYVKTSAFEGEFVVVPVGGENAKPHHVITLNETAGLIYDCIENGLDENAIAERLAAEYGIGMEKALRDVRTTVEKLAAAGVTEM